MRGSVTGKHAGLISPNCGFESRLRNQKPVAVSRCDTSLWTEITAQRRFSPQFFNRECSSTGQSAGLQNQRLQVRSLPFSQRADTEGRALLRSSLAEHLTHHQDVIGSIPIGRLHGRFHTPSGFVRLFFKMRGDVIGEHTGLICPLCGFESRLRDYVWGVMKTVFTLTVNQLLRGYGGSNPSAPTPGSCRRTGQATTLSTWRLRVRDPSGVPDSGEDRRYFDC